MTLPELNNRIFEVIEHYSDGNITEFSRSLSGISRQRLDRLFKVDPRSNKYPTVSPDIIREVLDKYPINSDWLIKGEGTMLKKKEDEAVPILNPNIKMIPLVSQYAQAGYLSGFGDEEYIKTLPKVPIIVDHEIKGEYIAFEVRGDSMDNGTEESLIEGDILIGRKIHIDYWKYKLHINKWNFIIVHKTDGIIVKRIADHNTDACAITAHSLNPLYPDVSYSLNDIDQLFNVVQILRSGRI